MKSFPKQKVEIIKIGKDIAHDITFSIGMMKEEQASRIVEILKRARDDIRKVLKGEER